MSHSMIETAVDAPVEGGGASSAAPQIDSHHADLVHAGGIRDGALYFQRCRWCHTSAFRRLLCPVCGSTDMAWERSGGIGVIRHVTVVGRGTGKPRAIALIGMSEGFRLHAQVIADRPDSACVGALVHLHPGPRPQEIVFRLCDSSAAMSSGATMPPLHPVGLEKSSPLVKRPRSGTR